MRAWKELEQAERAEVWDCFYDRFQFKPSVHPSDWPGIAEPVDSVTYHIGHVYDGDATAYDRRTNDLGKKLIRAFRQCVPPGDTIYVLDWQHPCYSFAPHDEFEFKKEEDWPVPALPNGDYYIFLARDMKFGVFGHPWEQTMCVFGQRFIDELASNPPELFTRKVRAGGHAV